MNPDDAPDNYTDEELIDAWLASWTDATDASPSWPDWELGYELAADHPERAWRLIVELAERARAPYELAILAAGALENLLCRHGAEFINRVESQSLASPQFQRCLSGVWGHMRMDPEVYRRMRLAAGSASF